MCTIAQVYDNGHHNSTICKSVGNKEYRKKRKKEEYYRAKNYLKLFEII